MRQKLRLLWERGGFYISLAALLAMLGGAGMWYRHAPEERAVSAAAPAANTPLPVQTPQPPFFQWPIRGEVLFAHAPNTALYHAETGAFGGHSGLDIAAESGAAVCAAEGGVVEAIYKSAQYGCTVEIRSGKERLFRYGGLSPDWAAEVGEYVYRGQIIGYVGEYPCAEHASGHHLHFEVLENGVSVDPMRFLEK